MRPLTTTGSNNEAMGHREPLLVGETSMFFQWGLEESGCFVNPWSTKIVHLSDANTNLEDIPSTRKLLGALLKGLFQF